MAYSRPVREAARRYWLLGYSDEKIVPLLKADFPNEKTPSRWHTISDWRHLENWETDLEIIAQKATEKRQEELATELAQMNTRQLTLLSLLDSHVQLMLTARLVRGDGGKPIDTQLSAGELAQAAAALDRSIKNQRLIRGAPTTQAQVEASVQLAGQVDLTQLTDEELERIAKGEDLFGVLSPLRQRQVGVKR